VLKLNIALVASVVERFLHWYRSRIAMHVSQRLTSFHLYLSKINRLINAEVKRNLTLNVPINSSYWIWPSLLVSKALYTAVSSCLAMNTPILDNISSNSNLSKVPDLSLSKSYEIYVKTHDEH